MKTNPTKFSCRTDVPVSAWRAVQRFISLFVLAMLAVGVQAAAPSTPTSPTPGSTSSPGPTLASSTVMLDWDTMAGATYYDVGVRDIAANVLVVDTTTASSSYTAVLEPGKAYRWNVAACNASGCSSYTTVRYFQTPGGAAPSTPTSPTPGSTSSPGPTLASSTVTLDWDTMAGTTYYDVGVRDIAANVLVVDTTTANSSYTVELEPGKAYRWNVAACNASGCSAYTTVRYFQTPGTIPSTPTSPTPGTTGSPGPMQASSTVALDWDTTAGATYYDLGVRDIATGDLVINTTTASSSYDAVLEPGKQYRWNVAACNANGCSAYTTVRYFQTPGTVPSTPTSPTPGTTDSPGPVQASSTVALDWDTMVGATYYDLGVRDIATGVLIVNTTTASSSYNAVLEPGKEYRWNVAACNANGCSAYTTVLYFQTPGVAPSTPTSPAPGTTSSPGPIEASSTVILDWDTMAGATYYDVGVRDIGTGDLVVDTTTVNSTYTAVLEPNKQYRWNVAACNASGCSSYTVVRHFMTPGTTPAPSISSVSPNPITADPANGYQTVTINGGNFVDEPALVLTWTGQAGYTVPASRVTYVSSSQLTMSIRLGGAADNWTARAVNPDGQMSSAVGFQVQLTPETPPSISGVSPDPVTGSANAQTITIDGANFVNKPTLTLTWPGQPGYTVPASQVTFVSSARVQMFIPNTTSPGTWTVRVTNPNGQSSGQANFTVTGVLSQPNLVPQNVTLSSYSVQAGGQVTVNWEIANSGSADCPGSITGLRVGQSPTTRPSSASSLNGNFPTPAVNAGLVVQQSTTVIVPPNTAAGTYYLWVIADNVANSTLHQSTATDDYAHSAAITVNSGPSLQGEPASLGVRWYNTPVNPNFRNRGVGIDTIVIHTTEGSTAQSAIDTLLARGLSSHYVIEPTGEIYQLVELSKSAYHATYYNNRSIGIEMVGVAANASTWNARNLAALKNLVAYLCATYHIELVHPPGDANTYPDDWYTETGIVAHSQVQPSPAYPRTFNGDDYPDKYDPGIYFPWASFIADVQILVDAPRFTIVDGGTSATLFGGPLKGFAAAASQAVADGIFKIHISTPSQQPVTVQASEDLVNWIDVGTVNMIDGKSVFTDTDAGAHSRRFYRPKP